MRKPKLRRPLAIALGLLTALLLAGCVRFQADLALNPDDTVDGSIVLAVVLGDDEGARDDAAQTVATLEAQVLPSVDGAVGATRSDYDQDGYYGTRFTFDDTPFSAFESPDGTVSLTRDGDEFVFDGVLDFTPDDGKDESEPDGDTSNVTVAITFPGDVTEHNGNLSGRTVSWEGTPQARIEMSARGSAIAAGPPAWVPVVAVIGGVVLVAALVVFVVLRTRVRRAPSER